MIDPSADESPAGALTLGDELPPPGPEDLMEEEARDEVEEDHYRNLVDDIPDEVLTRLAQKVIREEEVDRESRADWDEQLAKGLKLLGLDRNKDERSDPFPGASAVTHPLLMASVTDVHARIMKELMPAKGPVNTQILGRETPMKRERAQRVKDHMNYQLTIEVPDYRDETDSMFMLCPVTGSSFKKLGWDYVLKRPYAHYIRPQNLIVPYGAKSLENAPRYTERMELFEQEIKRLQGSGFWADIPLRASPDDSQITAVKEVTDRIQGETEPGEDEFDQHLVLEQTRECDEPEILEREGDVPEGMALPYVVTVHHGTGKVLAIRRNWRPEDETFTKRIWYTHYKFMPWVGFYGIGLLHLIGGIGIAATGALRALMDAAAIRTMPGGIRLRGSRVTGTTLSFRPLEFTEVDAPGVRDIRQVAMTYPMPAPDPSLFNLLGFLTTEGKAFANVATQAISEATNNGPVGTTLALIEQGSMVYSDIHARLHAAQAKEFALLAQLNHDNLDDEVVFKTFGNEQVVSWRDYGEEVDVVPVSDPSIFSQAQRATRAQAQMQLAQAAQTAGVATDLRKSFVNAAEAMNLPDADEMFPEQPQPQPLDPVSELMALTKGMPVQAFPGQAHEAHVAFLQSIAQDPTNQILMQMIGPRLMALIADHQAWGIRDAMEATVGPLPPLGMQLPPVVQTRIAQAVAGPATQIAMGHAQQAAQAQAGASQDAAGLAQAALADVQRKAEDDKTKAQIKIAELTASNRLKEQEAQIETVAKAADAQVRQQIASEEEATKIRVAEIEAASRERIAVMTQGAETARQQAENIHDALMGSQGVELKAST